MIINEQALKTCFAAYALKQENQSIKLALDALKELQTQGFIKYYLLTHKNDIFDRRGVDLFLITSQDNLVPIQIKSSKKGAQQHRKKYPYIPVVRPMKYDDVTIYHQLFQIINGYNQQPLEFDLWSD